MRAKSLSVSRRHFSAAERVRLLRLSERSQLTQREFVHQHGLSLATLARWRSQRRPAVKAPRRQKVRFAEVPLAQVLGTARWAAEIIRPDGWTVRLAHDVSAAWVEQLLAAC